MKSKNFLLLALMILLPVLAWADNPTNWVDVNAGTADTKQYVATIDKFVAAGVLPEVHALKLGEETLTTFESTDEVYKDVTGNLVVLAGENAYSATTPKGIYYLKVLVTRTVGENVKKDYIFVPFIVGEAVNWSRVDSKTTFDAAMTPYNEQTGEAGAYWMYYQKYPWCDVWYNNGDASRILQPGEYPEGDPESPGVGYYPETNEQLENAIAWYNALRNRHGSKITHNWEATGVQGPNKNNFVMGWPNTEAASPITVDDAIDLGVVVFKYSDDIDAAWIPTANPRNPGKILMVSMDEARANLGFAVYDEDFFSILMAPSDVADANFNLNEYERSAKPLIQLTAENTAITFDGDATNPFTYNGAEQKPDNIAVVYTGGDDDIELTDCANVDFDFEVVYPYDDDDDAEVDPDLTNATNYVDAGQKPFTIVAKGDYFGEIPVNYTIAQFDLSALDDEDQEIGEVDYTDEFTYNGSEQKPTDFEATVVLGQDEDANDIEAELGENDITIAFPGEDYITVGEKSFTITGKGNYKGTAEFTYAIVSKAINDDDIEVSYTEPDYTYNGQVQAPAATAIVVTDKVPAPTDADPDATTTVTLTKGTDYDLVYSNENSINAGDYTITITGKGNYAAAEDVQVVPSVKLGYTIKKLPLTDAMFNVYNNFTYDGNMHPVNVESQVDYVATFVAAGAPTVNLLTDDMFEVSYPMVDDATEVEENIEVGTWNVKFTAKEDEYEGEGEDKVLVWSNNFTGSVTKEVKIVGAALWINAAQTEKIYGEKDPAPKFTVDYNSPKQLARESDYAAVMEYLTFNRYNGDNGEDVGEHDYYIAQVPPSQRAGLNYDILIKDNTSLLIVYKRPAKITIEPIEKALGDPEPTFIAKPVAWDGEEGTIGGIIASDLETVTPAAPAEPYQILKDGVATITRAEGEDMGEYPFAVTSKNYDLEFEPENFTITAASASGAVCTIDPVVYNGQEQQPTVKVTLNGTDLVAGTDFQVKEGSWNNNKYVTGSTNALKASCVVEFINNYAGTADKTVYFDITKRPVLVTPYINEEVELETGYTFKNDDVVLEYSPIKDNANSGLVDDKDFVESTANAFVKPIYEAQATSDPIVFNIVKKTDGSSKNYEFVYANGEYVIGRALLTIHVSGTKVYGEDEEDAEWTITATGWKNGETEAQQQQYLHNNYGTDYFFTFERDIEDEENPEDAGRYDLIIEGPEVIGEEGNGYSVRYVDDGFVIKKAPLTITALTTDKYYSDDDPQADKTTDEGEAVAWPVSFTLDGLVNGDTEDDAKFYTFTYTTGQGRWQQTHTRKFRTYNVTREEGEGIGSYNITGIAPTQYAQQSVLRNYEITWKYQGAKLNINALDLVIKVSDDEITYGDDYVPAIEVESPTGLRRRLRAEIINAINAVEQDGKKVLQYSGIPEKTPINAGEYTISATGPAKAGNFTISKYNPGTLTVNQYELAVKANDQSLVYTTSINPYDVTIGEQTFRLEDDVFEGTGDKIKDVIALTCDLTHVGTYTPEDEPYGYVLNDNYAFAEEDDFEQGYLTIGRLDPLPLGAADLKAAIIDLGNTAKDAEEKWTLKQVLADHAGIVVNAVLPSDRSMVANDWYSWVLPFDVTPRMLSKDNTWGYAAVDILDTDKSEAKNVVLGLTVEKVPANTPFVTKVDESITADKMGTIVFNDVEIADFDYLNEDPKSVSKDGTVEFVGVYELKDDLAANEWALTRKYASNPRKFQPGPKESGVGLTQTRAYIWTAAESAADVRIYVQEPDGTTTSINGIEDEEAVAAEGWYTISGVKLEGEPTVTGTYIKDGKKVFFQAK